MMCWDRTYCVDLIVSRVVQYVSSVRICCRPGGISLEGMVTPMVVMAGMVCRITIVVDVVLIIGIIFGQDVVVSVVMIIHGMVEAIAMMTAIVIVTVADLCGTYLNRLVSCAMECGDMQILDIQGEQLGRIMKGSTRDNTVKVYVDAHSLGYCI